MSAIGGTIYLAINGRQRAIEGEFTFDPGGVTREQAEDANGDAVGWTERTRNSKFDATLYLVDGVTPDDIEAIADKPASITCPASGQKFRTDALTCSGISEVNLSKGTVKAGFFAPGKMV